MKALSMLVLATALTGLTGCMTVPGYSYRGGAGDYYYGQPSVDYNDRYGYSPYAGYSRYGYYYGAPYGYGSRWSLRYGGIYGYPHYTSAYYYPSYYYPRHAYYYPYRYPYRDSNDSRYEPDDDREGYHYAVPMQRVYADRSDGASDYRQLRDNVGFRKSRAEPESPELGEPVRRYRTSNDAPARKPVRPVRAPDDSASNTARAARMQRASRVHGALRSKRDEIEP